MLAFILLVGILFSPRGQPFHCSPAPDLHLRIAGSAENILQEGRKGCGPARGKSLFPVVAVFIGFIGIQRSARLSAMASSCSSVIPICSIRSFTGLIPSSLAHTRQRPWLPEVSMDCEINTTAGRLWHLEHINIRDFHSLPPQAVYLHKSRPAAELDGFLPLLGTGIRAWGLPFWP